MKGLTLSCIPLLTSAFLPISLLVGKERIQIKVEIGLDDQYPYWVICEHSVEIITNSFL